MNKKKVQLSKKLALSKEIIGALNGAAQANVIGGILPTGCVSACISNPKNGIAVCETAVAECTPRL